MSNEHETLEVMIDPAEAMQAARALEGAVNAYRKMGPDVGRLLVTDTEIEILEKVASRLRVAAKRANR